jgi:hypothetical protein
MVLGLRRFRHKASQEECGDDNELLWCEIAAYQERPVDATSRDIQRCIDDALYAAPGDVRRPNFRKAVQ